MTKTNLWEEDNSRYYLKIGKSRNNNDRYAIIYKDDKRNYYISAIPKEISREELDKLKKKIQKDYQENPNRFKTLARKEINLEEIKL